MRAFSFIFVAMWLMTSAIGTAAASENAFMGVWQQVFSTGGVCKDCSVSVTRGDNGIRVDASNGWSVHVARLPNEPAWLGMGKWTRSKSGRSVARDVITVFRIHQNQLILTMSIVEKGGREINVRAVFERSVRSPEYVMSKA